jgi:hypothetical protein
MKLTFFLLLLLPLGGLAKELYSTRDLSEKEIVEMYERVLLESCQHGDQFWDEWPGAPGAGYWGSGKSGEEGNRANSGMVVAAAALLKYSGSLPAAERQELLRKTLGSLRYATATHVSGPAKCVDGKHWGNVWQSAMWTANLAFGAWLIWDEADSPLRQDIKRVVVFETDRFLKDKPPTQVYNDTKAEENGWNLTCIALAPAMFPEHPHAIAWREKAVEYLVNTLSVPQDKDDATSVEGRPLNAWLSGANLHPDFTLENHAIFHPSYVACSSYFLTETMMYYAFAGKRGLPGVHLGSTTTSHNRPPLPGPLPRDGGEGESLAPLPASDHHLMDTWRLFQEILLPQGEPAYPQGMDWELHNLPYFNLFAALATLRQDRFAARMEQSSLQFFRSWQAKRQGDLALPGSPHGFGRHATTIDQVAYAFLAHEIFGPSAKPLSARQVAAQANGVHTHDWIEALWQRTDDKFVSFSWTNRLMGMLIPIGPGHDGNPYFTVPIADGFLGSFDLAPRGDTKTKVLDYKWRTFDNGFETSGELLRNGGRLQQTLRLTSLGEKTVVYQDVVVAMEDVVVEHEKGVPLGIENDEITGGQRLVSFQNGQSLCDCAKPPGPLAIGGNWVNIDSRLGMVAIQGEGMSYLPATAVTRGISVKTDLLYGSFHDGKQSFKRGQEVCRRIAVCYVNVTPKETSRLAQSCRVDGGRLHVTLGGGGAADIPLF